MSFEFEFSLRDFGLDAGNGSGGIDEQTLKFSGSLDASAVEGIQAVLKRLAYNDGPNSMHAAMNDVLEYHLRSNGPCGTVGCGGI